MNIKIEAFKACIFMLIGAFLFKQYATQSTPQELKQDQSQECKATIKKRTNPDGSVDEITEFLASHSQAQKIAPQDSAKKNGLYLGGGTNLKASIDLQLDKQMHQITTDGNKDHVYYFKYKVLEF